MQGIPSAISDHPNINLASFTFDFDPNEGAFSLIKPEYHDYVVPGQITVHRSPYRADFGLYPKVDPGDEILTNTGKTLLARVLQRVSVEIPKCVVKGRLEARRTGGKMFPGGGGCFCSWNNLVVVGTVIETTVPLRFNVGKPLESSEVIFYDESDGTGWAFTKNGSIYKFIREVEAVSVTSDPVSSSPTIPSVPVTSCVVEPDDFDDFPSPPAPPGLDLNERCDLMDKYGWTDPNRFEY